MQGSQALDMVTENSQGPQKVVFSFSERQDNPSHPGLVAEVGYYAWHSLKFKINHSLKFKINQSEV